MAEPIMGMSVEWSFGNHRNRYFINNPHSNIDSANTRRSLRGVYFLSKLSGLTLFPLWLPVAAIVRAPSGRDGGGAPNPVNSAVTVCPSGFLADDLVQSFTLEARAADAERHNVGAILD
jgi:hypothetical protein